MEIPSIINSDIQTFIAGASRQETAINSFQSVMQKAMESKNAVKDKELREACETFESYFLLMLMREMRKTVFDNSENSFIKKSNAEKIFTDMMDEEIAKTAAKNGGLGLADMLYKQLTMRAV